MCLVSVVVPMFNAEKYIEECINSILNQTHKEIEIIIVDDGSTDNSFSIVSKYGNEDNNIILLKQNNQGVSAARNSGIQKSSGEYICFVDSDDLLEKDFVESMLKQIASFDIAFGGHKHLFNNGKLINKAQRLLPSVYETKTMENQLIDDGTLTGIMFGSMCGVLYKTKTIKDNEVLLRPQLRVNEDGVFNLELLKYVNRFTVVPDCKYVYRQWKRTEKMPFVSRLEYIDITTHYIESNFAYLTDFKKQMLARQLSVCFWKSLNIVSNNQLLLKSASILKTTCNNDFIKTNYSLLSLDKINKYKKFLLSLLKHKNYLLFSIMVKYFVPFFIKRIKH